MADWWSKANSRAKLILSGMSIIALLLAWVSWGISVADDASDALVKTIELEQNDRILEEKIDNLAEKFDNRLDAIETKIEVSEAKEKIRDKYQNEQLDYQKEQLKRIEALLLNGDG